jgi:Cof subfamily protein (haloacid dehalogenase superfamily)
MIITDLDKSLLNSERQITDYTKDVFLKCMQNGIIVAFATARPLRAVKIFYDSIMPHAVICHSGAVVYINNELFYKNGITQIIAKNILEDIIANYPKAKLAIECNDEIFTNYDPTIYWKDIAYKNIDFEKFPHDNIDKIIIGLDSISNEINDLKKYLPNELYLETSEGEIAIIMSKEASKWNGIKGLLKYYKIKAENTVAFGDDYMDIEMIEKCGIGIAMENGIEEIKARAKYICGKNNEDGIAKWIEKNVMEYGQNCI